MKNSSTGRFIGSIISIVWVFVNVAISVKLLSEKRYYAASGWLILLIISLCFVYFYHLSPKTSIKRPVSGEITVEPSITSNIKEGIDNVLLLSTKDYIQVERVRGVLMNEGIHCIVLDQHSTVMLNFLPDVEMRIMVRSKDFERCAKIFDDMQANSKDLGPGL